MLAIRGVGGRGDLDVHVSLIPHAPIPLTFLPLDLHAPALAPLLHLPSSGMAGNYLPLHVFAAYFEKHRVRAETAQPTRYLPAAGTPTPRMKMCVYVYM